MAEASDDGTASHPTRSARLGELDANVTSGGAASAPVDAARGEVDLGQLLDELRAAQLELTAHQKRETIAELAVGIAHEVNTPAQYVLDNVSFLQRAFDKLLKLVEAQSNLVEAVRNSEPTSLALEAADGARREVKLDYLARQVPRAVEQSLQGLEEISTIVKAMKEFSRPSGPEKQPSDLHDLIEGVTVVTRGEWRYVAELDLDFDWNLPPVPLRRNEIAQAILNLVLEAARAVAAALPQASSHKGRITIATKLAGKQVEIRVSHSRRGAPESGQAEDLDAAGSPAGPRSLAFTRGVVVEHGGSLELEPRSNSGACFVICLPLAPS